MANPGKTLFSLFFVLTVLMYIVYSSDVTVVDSHKEEYNDAIRAASQIATLNIIDTTDINKLYDGDHNESSDLPINFEALDEFRSTLSRLLEDKKSSSLENISNINIPLVGFVTYEYVIGVTYGEAYKDANTLKSLGYSYEEYLALPDDARLAVDKQMRSMRGQYLLPVGYTLYVPDGGSIDSNIAGRTWRFTLGKTIYIPDSPGVASYNARDGRITETRYTADGTKLYKTDPNGVIISTDYYDIGMYLRTLGFNTVEELANAVVMQSINNYLNAYTGVGFNKTVDNTQMGLEFNLGQSNYSSKKGSYTSNSAVIEGPGLFAVIDLYSGSGTDMRLYERMASFGGSELVQTRSARASYGIIP